MKNYKYLLSFHRLFPFQPHYDVGILLTIVLAILTIILIFAFRYKCKSNRTWVSRSVKPTETVNLKQLGWRSFYELSPLVRAGLCPSADHAGH